MKTSIWILATTLAVTGQPLIGLGLMGAVAVWQIGCLIAECCRPIPTYKSPYEDE